MNGRSITPLCVLFVVIAITPVASGQTPPRRLSVVERFSALGRALTGGDVEEEPQPVAPVAAQGIPEQRPAFPHVNGQQLLPTARFGARTNPLPGQTLSVPQRTGSAQQPPHTTSDPTTGGLATGARETVSRSTLQPSTAVGAMGASAPRMATRTSANAVGEGEGYQDQYRLPGLGGSPLPATLNGGLGARGLSQDNGTAEGGGRQTFPTAASAASAATNGSPVRSSPQRRTPTYVDASDLRHDLSDEYSPAGQNASSSPTAENPSEIGDASNSQASRSDDAIGQNSNLAQDDAVFSLPANDDTTTPPPATAASPMSEPSTTSETPLRRAEARSGYGSGPQAGLETSPTIPADTNPVSAPSHSDPARSTMTTTAPTATMIVPIESETPAASNTGRTMDAGLSRTSNILVSNQAPIIATDIRGPKQIIVGREAVFRVRVHNQGNAAADGIEVTVRIPSWANVIDTNSTTGTVSQAPTMDAAGTLNWQLPRLNAGASEALDLKLVPRSSRPLELGVNWTVSPVGSRAVVEVQEPKIELNVSGPDEVLFGKPQLYRFTLNNPGTGVAENVRIELYPPGGGEKAAATNAVGNLAPGKSQTVEVELVARDPGNLTIKAIASAEGDLSSTAIKEVFCRKPELAIDWRGPEMKYAGTEATYHVRVRNPGTAPAEDVTVRATLPDGAQLTSASEGQSYDAARREIAWRVGSLGPGDDYYMELKCSVNNPGMNQLRLSAATSAGDLSDSKLVETNVIALADLKLEVLDPSGPVEIGADAVYEIRVLNRGASAAHDIQVVGMFSAGVEPVGVDGGQYSVSDGRVSFRTIEELAPGRQVVLKIRAQAGQPGMHVFRAEVLCRDLEIKLAAEETTRFYADETTTTGGSLQPQSEATSGFDSAP